MTPQQREDLDFEVRGEARHMDKWQSFNRWTPEARWERFIEKAIPWVCAIIAVPIAIILGAELLFHITAFFFHG